MLVEVRAGETFVVPPDYGHLQINPGKRPARFSYAVMDGMKGVYEPFRRAGARSTTRWRKAAERFVFNPSYATRLPLSVVQGRARSARSPFLNDDVYLSEIDSDGSVLPACELA